MEQVGINIEQEINEVKKDLEKLSVTEGWGKLSERQQKYIKDSLYISKRAYREQGANNPRYGYRLSEELAIFPEKEHQKNKFQSRYAESQNRISDWYCHYSVFVLENDGVTPDQNLKRVDKDFANEEFKQYPTLEDIEAKVVEEGFPCVVQVSDQDDNSEFDVDEMIHSFVVLGKGPDGLLLWAKSDLGQTYKLRTLEELYKRIYKDAKDDHFYWGVRKLRKLKD